MTLIEIEAMCVTPFEGEPRQRWELLFYALEEAVQRLLTAKIACDVVTDGSFFTEKPEPDDLDLLVVTDADTLDGLTEEQLQVLDTFNLDGIPNVDSLSITKYPLGHPHYGMGLDAAQVCEGYGLEHAEQWLKGYAVLKLRETDVGNLLGT